MLDVSRYVTFFMYVYVCVCMYVCEDSAAPQHTYVRIC